MFVVFQSEHLSIEKLLMHTIQVRSTAKLKVPKCIFLSPTQNLEQYYIWFLYILNIVIDNEHLDLNLSCLSLYF